MISLTNRITSPIKCPGGKYKLLSNIFNILPDDLNSNSYTYVEPFFGGGAVGLNLLYNKHINTCIFNDLNYDIVNLFNCIKSDSFRLLGELSILQQGMSKELFYDIRKGFKFISNKFEEIDPYRAAKFVFLNKTCFNGLIRFNASGGFNVPFGDTKTKAIYDIEKINTLKDLLQNTELYNVSYEYLIDLLLQMYKKQKDIKLLFYLDPPYLPISETSNFTSYTKDGFFIEDHMLLRKCLDKIDKANHKFILSNSSSPLTKSIFKGYNFIEVSAYRAISSSTRSTVKEYLIKNY
jgi:DNA adenine methylase